MSSTVVYKLLYNAGVHKILHRVFKPQTLTILSLHRVSNMRNYFWQPLSPEVFDSVCKYLQKKYHIIRFDEIEAYRKEKKPLLILSFDDGYYDFLEYSLPVLKKYNIPANQNLVYDSVSNNTTIWTQRLNILFNSFYESGKTNAGITLFGKEYLPGHFGDNWMRYYNFIYKSFLSLAINEREDIIHGLEDKYDIDTSERMMNWSDISTLIGNNIEIGNHSYSHEVISTLTEPAALDREIVLSKKLLEEKIGIPVNIFSYPNGQTKPGLADFLIKSGYQYILEMNEKINHLYKTDQRQVVFNRITIGDETFEKTILRIELLQAMFKKIFQ